MASTTLDKALRENLINSIRDKESFLAIKSPRDKRVLESMAKVDRKKFLPNNTPFWLFMHAKQAADMIRDVYTAMINGAKEQVPDAYYDMLERSVVESAATTQEILVPLDAAAYNDCPLPIGENQTCSQPSMVALMCDLLELREGMKVLGIGAGCGYHESVVAEMIGEKGRLVGIERIPELVKLARKNLNAYFGKGIEERVRIEEADGSIGFEEEAPYDRIYLTAGMQKETFDPSKLLRQLKQEDGILLTPQVSGPLIRHVYRDGELKQEEFGDNYISFVPLIGGNA